MQSRRVKTLSAGVVPVRFTRDGPLLLLLRAWRHWDFPKGGVEPGEAPLEAAIREVEEETGITDLDFAWGEACLDTGPYGNGKVSRYFAARTRTSRVVLPVNPLLGRPEHHEFRWCTPAQAARLLTPRVLEVLRWTELVIGAAAAPAAPTGASATSDEDKPRSLRTRPPAESGKRR